MITLHSRNTEPYCSIYHCLKLRHKQYTGMSITTLQDSWRLNCQQNIFYTLTCTYCTQVKISIVLQCVVILCSICLSVQKLEPLIWGEILVKFACVQLAFGGKCESTSLCSVLSAEILLKTKVCWYAIMVDRKERMCVSTWTNHSPIATLLPRYK